MSDLQPGTDLYVSDTNGQNLTRFVYLRQGTWLAAQRAGVYPLGHELELPGNGLGSLMSWESILSYLAKLGRRDEGYSANGGSRGYVQLRRIMPIDELASVIGRTPADVRSHLTNLIVQVDTDG